MRDDDQPPEFHDNGSEEALFSTIEVALSDDIEEDQTTNEDNLKCAEENEVNKNDSQADNPTPAEEIDSSS